MSRRQEQTTAASDARARHARARRRSRIAAYARASAEHDPQKYRNVGIYEDCRRGGGPSRKQPRPPITIRGVESDDRHPQDRDDEGRIELVQLAELAPFGGVDVDPEKQQHGRAGPDRARRNAPHEEKHHEPGDGHETEDNQPLSQRIGQQHAQKYQPCPFRIEVVPPCFRRPDAGVVENRFVRMEIVDKIILASARVETFHQQ